LGNDDYELDEQYYNNQDTYQQDDHDHDETAGFQMNSAAPSKWSRIDKNTIIGPNNEIRTKHDVALKHQAKE
jgi:hypothetical protein